MTIAWTCAAHPVEHGTFWRRGIELVQKIDPLYRRGVGKMHRLSCPQCCIEHKAGHVRPATEIETLKLIAARAA